MGIWDAFTEVVEAVTPWSVVEAEARAEESKEDKASESKKDSDDDEEEEEEEEDEEETVDPKAVLEEECKNSAQCAPAKHHFDECVERVHQQEADGEANEDCVEEFFHLAHCATACAAPALWSKLR